MGCTPSLCVWSLPDARSTSPQSNVNWDILEKNKPTDDAIKDLNYQPCLPRASALFIDLKHVEILQPNQQKDDGDQGLQGQVVFIRHKAPRWSGPNPNVTSAETRLKPITKS